jgi:hypothetical protein
MVMNTSTSTRLDIVAAVGLAIGGVFGLAGTFIGQASLQQSFWAIDAVGIVVATALLTMKYFRKGNDCVAAGFLVFVAAESLVLSNTAAGLTATLVDDRQRPSSLSGTAGARRAWPSPSC